MSAAPPLHRAIYIVSDNSRPAAWQSHIDMLIADMLLEHQQHPLDNGPIIRPP